MKPNKIKQMWAQGKPVTMGWISIANTFTAEIMGRQGFDAVCIDMQHGVTGLSNLMEMLQAVSATDASPVVRVGWNEPAAIMKALDFGASSIKLRALQIHGPDYFAKANEEILVMAMIETKEGLENLEEICSTPGVDVIYIGPADLSYALGMAPRSDNPDPLHVATCDRIKEVAHRHGKKVCMHCGGAEFASGAIKRGFDMVMLTSDIICLIAGVKRQVDSLKELTKSGS